MLQNFKVWTRVNLCYVVVPDGSAWEWRWNNEQISWLLDGTGELYMHQFILRDETVYHSGQWPKGQSWCRPIDRISRDLFANLPVAVSLLVQKLKIVKSYGSWGNSHSQKSSGDSKQRFKYWMLCCTTLCRMEAKFIKWIWFNCIWLTVNFMTICLQKWHYPAFLVFYCIMGKWVWGE